MKIRNFKLCLSVLLGSVFALNANAEQTITLDDARHNQHFLVSPAVADLLEREGDLSTTDYRLVCAANRKNLLRDGTYCVTLAEAKDYAAQYPQDFVAWRNGSANRVISQQQPVPVLERGLLPANLSLTADMQAFINSEGTVNTSDDRVHCVRRRGRGGVRINHCQTQNEFFWQQVGRINHRIHKRGLRRSPNPPNGYTIHLSSLH